jgi:hypothetical protein
VYSANSWQTAADFFEVKYLCLLEMLWSVVKKLNMEVIVCLCVKGFPRVPTWFRQLFPYSDWGAALNARITPLFFSWLVGPCEVGWLSTPSSMLHCFFTWLLSHTVHKHMFKCVFVRTVANSSKSTYLQHSSLLQHDEDSIECFFHLAMVLEWSSASQHHDLVFHFLKCNNKTQNTDSFTFSVLSFEQILRYSLSTPTVGGADQVSGE